MSLRLQFDASAFVVNPVDSKLRHWFKGIYWPVSKQAANEPPSHLNDRQITLAWQRSFASSALSGLILLVLCEPSVFVHNCVSSLLWPILQSARCTFRSRRLQAHGTDLRTGAHADLFEVFATLKEYVVLAIPGRSKYQTPVIVNPWW